MKPVIDASAFPVVHITYMPSPQEKEIDGFLQALRPVYQRGRLAILADINLLANSQITAKMRARLAHGIDAIVADFPGGVISEAVVANSAFVRGLFTAYQWVKREHRHPSKAFASMDEARAWTEQQIQRAGLKLST